MKPTSPISQQTAIATDVQVKACRFCALPMPVDASVCTHCSHHQSRKREFAQLLAGISGVIALVASGATFVATNWEKLRASVHWNDDAVLAQSQIVPGVGLSGIIGNRGDGPIYISHLAIHWNGGNQSFRVDKNVQPREFLPITQDDLVKQFEKAPQGLVGYLASPSGEPPKGLRTRTASNTKHMNDRDCATVVFFTSDSSEIARMNRFYGVRKEKLLTEPVVIEVYFLSAKTGEIRQKNVSGLATFVVKRTSFCSRLESLGWPE